MVRSSFFPLVVPKSDGKPDVAHRDGVAIVLYLLGPALRHGAGGPLVELLPSQELLHVRLGVVLVLLVPGLHEVQVVDGLEAGSPRNQRGFIQATGSATTQELHGRHQPRLGADGAVPPAHNHDLQAACRAGPLQASIWMLC